jgi:hypothetical protein
MKTYFAVASAEIKINARNINYQLIEVPALSITSLMQRFSSGVSRLATSIPLSLQYIIAFLKLAYIFCTLKIRFQKEFLTFIGDTKNLETAINNWIWIQKVIFDYHYLCRRLHYYRQLNLPQSVHKYSALLRSSQYLILRQYCFSCWRLNNV